MSFTWDRIHKHEDNIEQDVISRVDEYVCEFYGIEDTNDLTKEQIEELIEYSDERDYSVMYTGFRYIIDAWEDANFEEEDEE